MPSALLVLFASAALQGLSVVALPASATVLYDRLGLSAAEYGSLFVPQTVGALVGALLGAPLCRAQGVLRVLALSTGLHLVAQLLLAVASPGSALAITQIAAACLGLGFGLAAVPLNAAAPALMPRRAEAAIVAVHTAVGIGFATGPLAIGLLAEVERWIAYPIALLVLASLLLVATLRSPEVAVTATPTPASSRRPVWQLAPLVGVAIVYAFAEGTFANWATTYLREDRGVSAADAGLALSAFWAALALGRLLVAALLTRVRPIAVWIALPIAMAACLLALPAVASPIVGIVAYAAAGFAASAFFPLTVAIATERARVRPETISAVLTAGLMLGVGVASAAIGALRESLGLDLLFRLSAFEPLVALGLGLFAFSRRHAASHGDQA